MKKMSKKVYDFISEISQFVKIEILFRINRVSTKQQNNKNETWLAPDGCRAA
jgi:hypothetical protein